MTRILQFGRDLAGIVASLVRELADQNAYDRHLRVHGVEHSAEEWRRFSDARLRDRYARPKCC